MCVYASIFCVFCSNAVHVCVCEYFFVYFVVTNCCLLVGEGEGGHVMAGFCTVVWRGHALPQGVCTTGPDGVARTLQSIEACGLTVTERDYNGAREPHTRMHNETRRAYANANALVRPRTARARAVGRQEM